jgi:hypothetical protein
LADANFVSPWLWPVRLKKSSPAALIFFSSLSVRAAVAVIGGLVPLAGKISAPFLVGDWG